jgi:hypothetical protein
MPARSAEPRGRDKEEQKREREKKRTAPMPRGGNMLTSPDAAASAPTAGEASPPSAPAASVSLSTLGCSAGCSAAAVWFFRTVRRARIEELLSNGTPGTTNHFFFFAKNVPGPTLILVFQGQPSKTLLCSLTLIFKLLVLFATRKSVPALCFFGSTCCCELSASEHQSLRLTLHNDLNNLY